MILRGWKEIAAHLGSGVRTAQRWQNEGLPVRRPTKGPRSHVIADSEDLDSWRLKGPFWRTKDSTFSPILSAMRNCAESSLHVWQAFSRDLQLFKRKSMRYVRREKADRDTKHRRLRVPESEQDTALGAYGHESL